MVGFTLFGKNELIDNKVEQVFNCQASVLNL